MRRFALIAAAALMASACHVGSEAKDRDAGPQTNRNFPVGAFDKIEVAGAYDIQVVEGDKPSVTATGGEAILDETEVVVEDGTLQIRPKKENGFRWNWKGTKVKFTITAAALRGVALAGSGDVNIDKVSGDFEGELAGSGSLKMASVDANNLKLSIAGSGDASGAGKANNLELEIAGSGNVDIGGLAAKTADLSIAGSGNIGANVSETAKVSIAGSGNVKVSGGAKCEVSKFGAGNVSCS